MDSTPRETDVGVPIDPDESTTFDATETSTGLDENVAGALAYFLGAITGVVFYVLEPENPFVRFHAAQSIAITGVLFVVSVVFSIVGVMMSAIFFSGSTGGFLVGGLVSLVLGLVWLVVVLGTFGLWIYLLIRAYQGKTPRIPIAAGLADRLV